MARYHIKHEPAPSTLGQCVGQIEKQIRELRSIKYGPVGYRDACQEAVTRLEQFMDCDAYEHPPRVPKLPSSESEDAIYSAKCIRYLEALVRLGKNGKSTRPSDTPSDTRKKTFTRKLRMNTPATACANRYRQAIKSEPEITMQAIVAEYVEEHSGSAKYILRVLSDNPTQWR